MALGMNVTLRNARLDAITTFAAGAGLLRIYSGTRPATGAAITTEVLLAELTCNATFAPAAASGTLTLNAITQDTTANATGTASWFRLVKTDGTTHVFDGSVGTTGADINLNTVSIVLNAVVQVTSAVITEGNT